jgi:hypothetical protein
MKIAFVLLALPGWIVIATMVLVWLTVLGILASVGVGFLVARIFRNQSLHVLFAVSLPALLLILLNYQAVHQIETFGELLAPLSVGHFVAVVGTAALRVYFRNEQV